ncbi:MAG: dCTP deaminase domain-containing protein [Pyrinomonadaceae bacterium]
MTNPKDPSLFDQSSEIIVGALADTDIEREVAAGKLISKDTFVKSSLDASSYDISVGKLGILGGDGREIDLTKESLELGPGAFGGIISYEKLVIPNNIHGRIGSKRAMAYDGVILLTGSTVDPGYTGHLVFGLYNASQRRVVIRSKRKICNIVFERLVHPAEKGASSDPDLEKGEFPSLFVDKLTNMEVLPWMQISERVKQIEAMTSDILDLKARYEDVLQPIRDLTNNVKSLTDDVNQNGRQITELTANINKLVGQVDVVKKGTEDVQATSKKQGDDITNLQVSVGRYGLLVYIFWGILLLIIGALLAVYLPKLLSSPPPTP